MRFRVGDLIEFYNKDFLKKFKSKIMEFKGRKSKTSNAKMTFNGEVAPPVLPGFLNFQLHPDRSFQNNSLLDKPLDFRAQANPPGRRLNFDANLDEYEICPPKLRSRSQQNPEQLPQPFEFGKMVQTRSPEQHVLQKFKTDLTQNIASPKDPAKTKTFEALRQEGRPKIYQAQRKRTPDSSFNSIRRYQRNSHDPAPPQTREEASREYQSYSGTPPVKFESGLTQRSSQSGSSSRGPNSRFLKNTYQILNKPMTSNKTTAFSYFTKKKVSANKVGLPKSRPLNSMTRMTRTTGFHERTFLGSDQKQRNLQGPSKKSQRGPRGKNLYSKGNLTKYKASNFSQTKNYKAKIEEASLRQQAGAREEGEERGHLGEAKAKTRAKTNYSIQTHFDPRKNLAKKLKLGMKSPVLGDSMKKIHHSKKRGKKALKHSGLYQRNSHFLGKTAEEDNPTPLHESLNKTMDAKKLFQKSPNLQKYGFGQFYKKKK